MKMKKNSNVNNRKCIITNEKLPKEELIRIVKKKDNTIIINSNEQGRGAYIKKDKELIDKIKRTKALHRVFRFNVDSKTYEQLCEILNKLED